MLCGYQALLGSRMFDLLVSTFQAGLWEIEADQILTSGYEKVLFFLTYSCYRLLGSILVPSLGVESKV